MQMSIVPDIWNNSASGRRIWFMQQWRTMDQWEQILKLRSMALLADYVDTPTYSDFYSKWHNYQEFIKSKIATEMEWTEKQTLKIYLENNIFLTQSGGIFIYHFYLTFKKILYFFLLLE